MVHCFRVEEAGVEALVEQEALQEVQHLLAGLVVLVRHPVALVVRVLLGDLTVVSETLCWEVVVLPVPAETLVALEAVRPYPAIPHQHLLLAWHKDP